MIQPDIPNFVPCSGNISLAKFGKLSGVEILKVAANAYNEIVTWKKNIFKLPGNATGKAVRTEMTKLCDAYSNKTDMEQVALKLLIIICPLLLQKSSKNSKSKENVQHLKCRLGLW